MTKGPAARGRGGWGEGEGEREGKMGRQRTEGPIRQSVARAHPMCCGGSSVTHNETEHVKHLIGLV